MNLLFIAGIAMHTSFISLLKDTSAGYFSTGADCDEAIVGLRNERDTVGVSVVVVYAPYLLCLIRVEFCL